MTFGNGRMSFDPPYGPILGLQPFELEGATAEEAVAEVGRLVTEGSTSAARAVATRAAQRFPGDRRIGRWCEVLAPAIARVQAPDEGTTSAELKGWLSRSGAAHVGKWVAVNHGELLASGDTVQEIRQALDAHPSAVGIRVGEESVRG
ncbi:MAG: hypothetical protein ABMA64_00750 [Myxococcota bacterium]